MASADGTLRKLGEKDLLLQTGKRAVLRFRLLAKTKFENKAGEAIRDSLLHPGDQISVQVSPDDPETAVRVVLVRAASPAERSAAEQPVEEAAVRAPVAGDLSKPRTVTTREAATAPADATAPAATCRGRGCAQTATPCRGRRRHVRCGRTGRCAGGRIQRSAALHRCADHSGCAHRRRDIQREPAQLPGAAGDEPLFRDRFPDALAGDRRGDRRSGLRGRQGGLPQLPGSTAVRSTIRSAAASWSTGEFGTTLEDVMSLGTNAAFKRRGEEKMVGRTAVVYDYSVAQGNSHWTMVSPDGRQYKPAYEGAVWIDKESRRVLRIEQRATCVSARFHDQPGGMQAAICLGEDRAEELSAAVVEREYRLHERQRGVHAERAGVQELPEVHDGKQYHVREVVEGGRQWSWRPQKVMAPSWVLGACTQRVAVGGDSPPGCCLC